MEPFFFFCAEWVGELGVGRAGWVLFPHFNSGLGVRRVSWAGLLLPHFTDGLGFIDENIDFIFIYYFF